MNTARHDNTWAFVACLVLSVLAGCGTSAPEGVDASFIHIPGENDKGQGPVVTWNTDSVDLGILAAGEVARATYTFQNTGASPLVIAQVLPSCGCTVARDWPTSPIAPGKEGAITLEFNAGDRSGTVSESATVVSNAVPSSFVLQFSARVMGPISSPAP
jgi:hypothetical protein